MRNVFLNVAAAKVRGVDLEATYTTDVGAGSIALRGLVSYLDENSITNVGVPTDNEADDILAGLPRWKATAHVMLEPRAAVGVSPGAATSAEGNATTTIWRAT